MVNKKDSNINEVLDDKDIVEKTSDFIEPFRKKIVWLFKNMGKANQLLIQFFMFYFIISYGYNSKPIMLIYISRLFTFTVLLMFLSHLFNVLVGIPKIVLMLYNFIESFFVHQDVKKALKEIPEMGLDFSGIKEKK